MTGEEGLQLLRDTLGAPEVRIEVGFAFSATEGSSQCAFFEIKDPSTMRWRKVKELPAILPPAETPNRVGLLRTLADVLESAELMAEVAEKAGDRS